MQFAYSTLKPRATKFGSHPLLVLVISLIVAGGLLIGGGASVQDKFKMADASTATADSKRLSPKSGFELVAKDKTTVVARKTSKGTMSVDARVCGCTTAPPPGTLQSCSWSIEGNVAVCGGGNSSACCKWVPVQK